MEGLCRIEAFIDEYGEIMTTDELASAREELEEILDELF